MSICMLPEHRDLFTVMGSLRYQSLLATEKRAFSAIENATPDPVLGDRVVSLEHIRRIGLVTTAQIIGILNKCERWRIAKYMLISAGGDVQAIVLPWSRREEMPHVFARISGVRVVKPCEIGKVLSGQCLKRRTTA